MANEFSGNKLIKVRDSYGLRIYREIMRDGEVVRKITLQTPSDDRLTALTKQEPATLTMPAEGVEFQTISVQLWPPHSQEEARKIITDLPLLALPSLVVEEVDCYDPHNMVSWGEIHASRPDEAGPWTPEGATGLLNAVHISLSANILPQQQYMTLASSDSQ